MASVDLSGFTVSRRMVTSMKNENSHGIRQVRISAPSKRARPFKIVLKRKLKPFLIRPIKIRESVWFPRNGATPAIQPSLSQTRFSSF